jgi:hypothetical protein
MKADLSCAPGRDVPIRLSHLSDGPDHNPLIVAIFGLFLVSTGIGCYRVSQLCIAVSIVPLAVSFGLQSPERWPGLLLGHGIPRQPNSSRWSGIRRPGKAGLGGSEAAVASTGINAVNIDRCKAQPTALPWGCQSKMEMAWAQRGGLGYCRFSR